jgi:hypothetical protein
VAIFGFLGNKNFNAAVSGLEQAMVDTGNEVYDAVPFINADQL